MTFLFKKIKLNNSSAYNKTFPVKQTEEARKNIRGLKIQIKRLIKQEIISNAINAMHIEGSNNGKPKKPFLYTLCKLKVVNLHNIIWIMKRTQFKN